MNLALVEGEWKMTQCRARMARTALFVPGLLLAGCQLYVDEADRQVYRLVEKRQIESVGVAHSPRIDTERVPIKPAENAYDFVPDPVQADVPDSFKTAAPTSAPSGVAETLPAEETTPGALEGNSLSGRRHGRAASQPAEGSQAATEPPNGNRATTEPASPDLQTPEPPSITSRPTDSGEIDASVVDRDAKIVTLSGSLAYAFEHARDFQSAKEDLYLAALALTLERHLWTPQLVSSIRSQYANFGEVRHFDHAMDAVARVAAEQKLPYGGRITAEVLGTLLRDLTNNVTTGEIGSTLLTAEIPLLKGAGPVAYETRYRAERELIYAIRAFERFRRALAVSVAADYFNLQQLREQITNAAESIEAFKQLSRRARAFWKTGKATILDVQRAEQDQLTGTNNLVDAIERYRTALDEFKIQIGMPTAENITVSVPENTATRPADMPAPAAVEASAELVDVLAMPAVDEAEALRVALKYRLDLINDLDRIGDAERGVVIAENAILPQLNAFGSVRFDTDPEKIGMLKYESDRTIFRGGLELEIPLDRKKEQTQLRESLITKRRAERNYDLARDTVVKQVRQAMRRVEQQRQSVEIQLVQRKLAQRRLQAAQFRFQKGLDPSLEVVDAQNELLDAQNRLAQAEAAYKVAILQFWRDTDMLRIADDGHWEFELARATANGKMAGG